MRALVLAVGLVAAVPAFGGERCEAARATFAKVAPGYACSREIWWAGLIDCTNDTRDLRRFWDLTEECTRKVAQSPSRVERVRVIEEERVQVKSELEPLLAERISLGTMAFGIVPAAGGGILILGSLLQGVSFNLFGGGSQRPWTLEQTGMLIGGSVAVLLGAAVILAVVFLHRSFRERINPLQARLDDLDSARDQETRDEQRLKNLRDPPQPALPISAFFTMLRF